MSASISQIKIFIPKGGADYVSQLIEFLCPALTSAGYPFPAEKIEVSLLTRQTPSILIWVDKADPDDVWRNLAQDLANGMANIFRTSAAAVSIGTNLGSYDLGYGEVK